MLWCNNEKYDAMTLAIPLLQMPHQQQRIFGPRLGPAEVPQQQRIQVVLCFVNQHRVL